MEAVHLTKADFLQKVADYENNPNEWKFLGERPALIDFFASLAALFGIRSVPSLLFVPMAGAPQMAQGAMPKPSLVAAINEVLLNKK